MTPEFEILICDADARDDGVMLLTLGRNTRSIHKASACELVVALDPTGRVVWQKQLPFCVMDCRLSLQNTLLIMATDGRAVEMGFNGQILHQWYCKPMPPAGADGVGLATQKLHHTIQEIAPDIYLSMSIRQHPLAKANGAWTHLMSDTVLVFDRKGDIHWEWDLHDILDPTRTGYGCTTPYWPNQGWAGTQDWTHANCAVIDPTDGGILLSLRHQDAVVKLTRRGELDWILGDSAGWCTPWADKVLPIEGGRPFYHQHDLSFAANGDLMLFDTGTAGALPPNPEQPIEERESFALSYRIERRTEGRRAVETWRYGGAELPYSHYGGGVVESPNRNRFIACTGLCADLDGSRVEIPPKGVGQCEFKEVTPNGDVVFHARLQDVDAGPDAGWNGFRAEYLSTELAAKLC